MKSALRGMGVVQCEHFSDKAEEILQMRTSVLFDAKKLRIFRNLWCVLTVKWGGRFEPVRTFCGQGEGINFSRFCADVLYGLPLAYA